MRDVRITQLDGKLPNLALMRLSAWHRECGDRVHYHRSTTRQLGEPEYGAVYGSAIFSFSAERVERFRRNFPEAIVGGTGSGSNMTLDEIVPTQFVGLDYSPWKSFTASLGFTQRGCRLSCKFCVVPTKEGKPRAESTIDQIWRGPGYPKNLHLLDNDFFGQAEDEWRARIEEIKAGGFRVCFNQGINIRAITPDTAAALASVEYRDDGFKRRRLYTAWDNMKDEGRFFAGVDMLADAGVPPRHLMAYMLVGFFKGETMESIQYRFNRMASLGIRPYPMVYGDRPDLKRFQRWAVTGLYRSLPFADYRAGMKAKNKPDPRQPDMFV